MVNHESTHKFLPSSGWSWRWNGEPDAGYGEDQPGGWGYSLLEYMEENSIRNAGKGVANAAAKEQAMLAAVGTPIPAFICPTRRPAVAYPLAARNGFLANNLKSCVDLRCMVARTDYHINSGNVNPQEPPGDSIASAAQAARYDWVYEKPGAYTRQSGISYQHSEIKLSQIVDGTSKTIAMGEKYLNVDNYLTGADEKDDQNIFVGHDRDVNGYTYFRTEPGTATARVTYQDNAAWNAPPVQDRPGWNGGSVFRYGSAHPAGIHVVFCDASVQSVAYDINPRIFWAMGGRDDEEAVSE
jgi:hypothetical protein